MQPTHEPAPSEICWLRAILTAAIIVAVGIAVLLYGTNAVLTKVHSIHRPQRVAIATLLFFVALFALAAALRWLQRRRAV